MDLLAPTTRRLRFVMNLRLFMMSKLVGKIAYVSHLA